MYALPLLQLYSLLLGKNYAVTCGADERHQVLTDDGVRLTLTRYLPRGSLRPTSPIFCVHGLGANRFNFDTGADASLARYLAEQGYDCWLLDLRGCGESETPRGRRSTFDDYVRHDLPAALEHIRASGSGDRVHWVGHSMGGMLLYAYAATHGDARLHSGVTLGSPVRFSPREDNFHAFLAFERLIKVLPNIPTVGVGRLVTPLLGLVNNDWFRYHMNVDNIEWETIRRAYYNITSQISPGVLLQFFEWIRHDDFFSLDRQISYRSSLVNFRVPLFVLAGGGDLLVPKDDIREAYERAASPLKLYLELGCQDGFCEDYGHIDLLFGRRAREEVYPRIAAWLAQFSGEDRKAA